jgi:cobalamin biosynthesis Mg chelatase CobN
VPREISGTIKTLEETTMSNTAAPEYPNRNTTRAPEYGTTGQVTETATEARQGVTGHNVSTVLVVSLVGVIVAFAIVYALFFA